MNNPSKLLVLLFMSTGIGCALKNTEQATSIESYSDKLVEEVLKANHKTPQELIFRLGNSLAQRSIDSESFDKFSENLDRTFKINCEKKCSIQNIKL